MLERGAWIPGLRLAENLAVAMALAAIGCADQPSDRTARVAIDSAFTFASRPLSPPTVNAYLVKHLGFTSRGGVMRCAYVPLGQQGDRIFVNTACIEHVRDADSLAVGSGRGGPVALRIAISGDTVAVTGHEVPVDGGGYRESVRRIFPAVIADRILRDPAAEGLRDHLRLRAAPQPERPLRGSASG